MTREEAKRYLIEISYTFGSMSIEYLTEKDGEKMRDAIKLLEQESVLDEIRAEIDELPSYVAKFNGGDFAIHIDKEKVFEVIDKYMEERNGGDEYD